MLRKACSLAMYELEMRIRAFQEDRARSGQENEELRRTCRTDDERARQLRNYELSQIQELHDKVNSLNESREFYDPETEQFWVVPPNKSA